MLRCYNSNAMNTSTFWVDPVTVIALIAGAVVLTVGITASRKRPIFIITGALLILLPSGYWIWSNYPTWAQQQRRDNTSTETLIDRILNATADTRDWDLLNQRYRSGKVTIEHVDRIVKTLFDDGQRDLIVGNASPKFYYLLEMATRDGNVSHHILVDYNRAVGDAVPAIAGHTAVPHHAGD